jgi:histone deacetylase complex regulatory component SIN3
MFEGKCNESYHKFIPSVPLMKNSTDDPIAIENCNKYYFSSQPVGDKNIKENNVKNYESGVAKKNTMKNVYEETLFKIEDERFEVDVSIERYRFVLKWLEKLIDPATPEDQCSFFIEKIRKFQVIEQIYGQKTEDIIKGLESHKTSIAPIVIARFQEKLDMFKEIKAKYERENWVQSLDACFHRSLDQKSFSIKYYDKKLVLNKSRLGLTRLHRRVGVQRPNSSQWDQRVEEQNP